jgi:hypothetical protein
MACLRPTATSRTSTARSPWLGLRSRRILPLALLVSVAAGLSTSAADAVTLKQTGPYNCGGLSSSLCEVEFVGSGWGRFDASEAPTGSVKVSMAGVSGASSYANLIHRVERLQREQRSIVLEPAGGSEAQSSFALATLLLFDQGESELGTPSYIDETLFPDFGGWWANPEYTVQGVRKQNGIWSRSFSTTWAVVALPGTPEETVTMPYRVRRANTQERFTSFKIRGGEGRVLFCEPEQTPGRLDCPGYYGAEAELSPQPLNPWAFL